MNVRFLLMILVVFFCSTVVSWAGGEHEAQGVVDSINQSERKISISHQAIETLGMGAMTMTFLVADPAMLSEVKVGQAIEFVVMKDRRGRFVVVDLQLAGD
mgnify:CR=1 FL=1